MNTLSHLCMLWLYQHAEKTPGCTNIEGENTPCMTLACKINMVEISHVNNEICREQIITEQTVPLRPSPCGSNCFLGLTCGTHMCCWVPAPMAESILGAKGSERLCVKQCVYPSAKGRCAPRKQPNTCGRKRTGLGEEH